MISIRSRLLIGLLGGMLVMQFMVYGLMYAKMEDEIDDLFDGELERTALAYAAHAALLPVSTPHRDVENPQQGMIVTVWAATDAAGEDEAPEFQSAPLAGLSRATPTGFSKIMLAGVQWRLFGTRSAERFVVTAQPAFVRDVAARKIAARVFLPSLAVIPGAAMLIWWAVAFGLRPLVRITSDLRARSHRDLAPIDPARLPPDVAPVVHALNEWMGRLGNIIAAQRNFIADAAHELLTPLTALRLQVQLLTRGELPPRQRETIYELQGGVARTLQLARQLLTLARHGADSEPREWRPVDLGRAVLSVIELHRPVARAKSIHLDVEVEDFCQVDGCEEALQTLMANLIDNAVKYSDADGKVHVRVTHEADRVVVTVEDSGPGIPAEERERVFDRFYRRPGLCASGSGLGLSIAREIASRHGTEIVLAASEDLGGVLARIEFAVGTPAVTHEGRWAKVA